MSSIGKDQTERKSGFPRNDERGVLKEGLCQRSEGVGSVHGIVAGLVGRLVLCHGECEQTRTKHLEDCSLMYRKPVKCIEDRGYVRRSSGQRMTLNKGVAVMPPTWPSIKCIHDNVTYLHLQQC